MSQSQQLSSSETLERILLLLSQEEQSPLSTLKSLKPNVCDEKLVDDDLKDASHCAASTSFSSTPEISHHETSLNRVARFLIAHEKVTGRQHSDLIALLMPSLDSSVFIIDEDRKLKTDPAFSLRTELSASCFANPNINTLQLEETRNQLALSQEIYSALLSRSLYTALGALLTPHPELKQIADDLHTHLANSTNVALLADSFHRLFDKCEEASLTDKRLLAGLRRLLDCVSSSVSTFGENREGMDHQMAALKHISSSEPLTLESIKNAELALIELSALQASLKENLLASRRQIKELIRDFVAQVASDAGVLGEHTQKMDDLTREILSNDDLPQIHSALDALALEARDMASRMHQTHRSLAEKEQKITEAQHQIDALQKELAALTQKVKEDALTGALNRRGLEEVALRDISLASRGQQSLCLAVLDLDDFKRFNDELGHTLGDQALRYLVSALKKTLRPADSIARFGGEEFVLLLSHSSPPQAQKALMRAQNSLTQLFGTTCPRPLTFSAGITQWQQGDSLMDMVGRADVLMYKAKKSGKRSVYIESSGPKGLASSQAK